MTEPQKDAAERLVFEPYAAWLEARGRADMAQAMRELKPAQAAGRVEAFEATPANIDARTQRFEVGGLKAAVLAPGPAVEAI